MNFGFAFNDSIKDKEQQDKVEGWMDKHLGDEGSQKRFTGAALIMVLVWPIFVICYLLSFKFHT